jgi:hypothetical protein
MRFGTTILSHRPGRRKTHWFFQRRAGAKSSQPPQIEQQTPGQRSAAHRHMHDPLAAERRTKLFRRQHRDRRQVAPERAQLAAARIGAVERKQQKRGPPASHRLADPVEPGDGKAGAARQAKRIATPPRQLDFQTIGQVRRRNHRPPRCPRESPFRHRPFHYIPARRQPQTPSRQPRRDIRHHRAVGTNDKPYQRVAVAHLTGDDAAALRPLLVLGETDLVRGD